MILVEYNDAGIIKYGIWRKGKVELWDKDHTIVRKWAWVKIVNPIKAVCLLITCLKIDFKVNFRFDYSYLESLYGKKYGTKNINDLP